MLLVTVSDHAGAEAAPLERVSKETDAGAGVGLAVGLVDGGEIGGGPYSGREPHRPEVGRARGGPASAEGGPGAVGVGVGGRGYRHEADGGLAHETMEVRHIGAAEVAPTRAGEGDDDNAGAGCRRPMRALMARQAEACRTCTPHGKEGDGREEEDKTSGGAGPRRPTAVVLRRGL